MGPLILGHAHPAVVAAVQQAAAQGLSFGAPTDAEVETGASCCASACRRLELVRLVSSGTEATMSAIRLARGYTGRAASSSSKAAITAMPMRCSSRRVPAR